MPSGGDDTKISMKSNKRVIGLFWDKETGEFLGVAQSDKDKIFIPWKEWKPLHEIITDDEERETYLDGIDFTQPQHIYLMHEYQNSVCVININGRLVRVC